MSKKRMTCYFAMSCLMFMTVLVMAQDAVELPEEAQWPREIVTPNATVVLYQPQVERFEKNSIDMRLAASVKLAEAEEPVFGAVWLHARVETDREAQLVRFISLEAVRSRFPGATAQQEDAFADLLKQEMPKWELTESISQLQAGLDAAKRRDLASEELNHAPPKIIYRDAPAVLILIDGKPILEKIDGSALMAVVNTPFPMLYRPSDKTYYLMGDGGWYRSKSVTGDWQYDANPPSEVKSLRPDDTFDPEAPKIDGQASSIIVTTEPAELVCTEGAPQYVPLEGGDVLFVSNTESDILFEPMEGQHFLLISGRWYKSKDLAGTWRYVGCDDLPESFIHIPPESEKGEVLASVCGTPEACEAVMDAHIPQTSAIIRSEAKLKVEYDGEPEFDQIPGTSIKYAANSATPVIETEGRYYAVDNGVWFTASQPTGPWVVCDAVPDQVQDIPPSSPLYNIKYVYVYDSTPEVVYVGYTPGYVGTYVCGGTVVYGTGYYYHPWYRTYYYPRPVTWGFSVRYSSYYGWSFGVTYSSGPFTLCIGHGWGHYPYHGWWGPPWYRPPYYRPPYYRPPYYRPPYYRPPKPELYAKIQPRVDLYSQRPDRSARPSTGQLPSPERPTPTIRPAQGDRMNLQDNIYTDRDGNVYRSDDRGGWERREGNRWTPETPSTQPAQPSVRPTQPSIKPSQPSVKPSQPSTRPSQPSVRPSQPSWQQYQPQLQRDYQNRQRSNQRTLNYQRSRQGISHPAARAPRR